MILPHHQVSKLRLREAKVCSFSPVIENISWNLRVNNSGASISRTMGLAAAYQSAGLRPTAVLSSLRMHVRKGWVVVRELGSLLSVWETWLVLLISGCGLVQLQLLWVLQE